MLFRSVALVALGGWWQEQGRVQRLRQLAWQRAAAAPADWQPLAAEVDPQVLVVVRQQLTRHLAHRCPDFPLQPADRLQADLGIDEDTLVMALGPQLAALAGRSMVAGPAMPWRGRVHTVADLVRCLDAQPVVRSARVAAEVPDPALARS